MSWRRVLHGGVIAAMLVGSTAISTASASAAVNFQRTDYALGSPASAMAVGDLNGKDGPDLVAVGTADDLTVLLNNGDGTFGAPQTYPLPTGCKPGQVALNDFENPAGQQTPDGNLDAMVLCNGTGKLVTLAGNGDGSFGAAQTLSVYLPGYLGGYTSNFAIGAFDYYSRAPVVTYRTSTDEDNGEEGVFCTFDNFSSPDPACKDPASNDPGAPLINGTPVAVDFDGSGQQGVLSPGGPDGVVIWEQDPGPPVQWDADEIPFGEYATGQTYGGLVTAGDLNGDGHQDIITSSSTSYGGVVNTIMWNGVAWAAPQSFPSVAGVNAIVTGDFDGDGHTDVLAATGYGQAVVFSGDGAGNLGAPQSIPLIGNGNPDYASVVQAAEADIDGNGTPDVVILDDSAGTFEVLRNGAAPTSTSPTTTTPVPVPPAPAPGSAGPLVPPGPVTHPASAAVMPPAATVAKPLTGITKLVSRVRISVHSVLTLGQAANPPTSSVALTLSVPAPVHPRGGHTTRAGVKRASQVVIGRITIKIPKGTQRALRLTLNRAGRTLFTRHMRVSVTLTLVATGPRGTQTRQSKLTVTRRG